MVNAYLNRVATAVPPHDIHQRFSDYASATITEERERALFKRMASRSQIEHRYSFLKGDTSGKALDGDAFYRPGDFPDTGERMRFYQAHAFELARKAIDQLNLAEIKDTITHVIVTSCTGFYAPGLDLQIVEHYKLNAHAERTLIGFMGCYAAFNGLKMARHIVRSEPKAKVLTVNLELCTLHLQPTDEIEQLLSYLIFADGCAASLISAEPSGILMESFFAITMPESAELITWTIGESGFDMVLSGEVPSTIANTLPTLQKTILKGHDTKDFQHWALHPGGRSVLDAVQKSLSLPDAMMLPSRRVLRDFGNMSSATVMFVFKDIIETPAKPGLGCAMAFGPGVTLESMLFRKV